MALSVKAFNLLFGMQLDPGDTFSQLQALTVSVADLQSNWAGFQKTTTSTKNMLSNVGTGLVVAGTQVNKLSREVMDFGKTFLGVTTSSVAEAEDFQVAMARLGTVVPEADQLEKLRNKALTGGLATGFLPTESADALREIAAAGFDADTSMKALDPTLKLVAASAGQIDLSKGAEIAAVTMNKFQRDVKDLPEIFNQFTVATQKSNIEFKDLSVFLDKIGAAPRVMANTTIPEFLAIAAASRNLGQTMHNTGFGIQAISRGFQGLFKTTKGFKARQEALSKLGISRDQIVDQQGNFKSMTSLIDLFGKKAKSSGLPVAEQFALLGTIFDQNAARLIIQLAGITKVAGASRETAADMAKLTETFQQAGLSSSALDDASKKFLETWAGAKKQFAGTISTLKILFGEVLLPGLTAGLRQLNAFLLKIVEFTNQSKAFRLVVLGVITAIGLGAIALGGLIGVFGTGLIVVGTFLQTMAGLLTVVEAVMKMTKGLRGAIVLLTEAVEALVPILGGLGSMALPLIAAITIAIVALGLAWARNVGGIRDKTMQAFEGVFIAFQAFLGFITGDGLIDKALADQLRNFPILTRLVITAVTIFRRGKAFVEGFFGGLFAVIDDMRPEMETLWALLSQIAENIFAMFGVEAEKKVPMLSKDFWTTVGAVIGFVVGGILRFAVEVTNGLLAIVALVTYIQSIPSRIKNFFGDIFARMQMGEAGKSLVDQFLEGFKEAWKNVLIFVISAVDTLVNLLGGSKLWDPERLMKQWGVISGSQGQMDTSGMPVPFGGVQAPAPAPLPTVRGGAAPANAPGMVGGGGGSRVASTTVNVNLKDLNFKVEKMTPDEMERVAHHVSRVVGDDLQRQLTAGMVG